MASILSEFDATKIAGGAGQHGFEGQQPDSGRMLRIRLDGMRLGLDPEMVKIYTKTGDAGDTGLYGGRRVSKSAPRVWAYGEVDEACSLVGVIRSELDPERPLDQELDEMLLQIQDDLMVVGSDLATPLTDEPDRKGTRRVVSAQIARLEGWIDTYDAEPPALKNFILPGGSRPAAKLLLARTVVRRAERATVGVGAEERISEHLVPYLNRLSDLLFVLGRVVNHRLGVAEQPWNA